MRIMICDDDAVIRQSLLKMLKLAYTENNLPWEEPKCAASAEDKADTKGRFKRVPNHVMVYEVVGPMFFGAADKIPHISEDTDKSVLILRMRAVPAMDITALNGLRHLWEECQRSNIQMVFSHVNEQPLSVLKKAGLYDMIGGEHFQSNIDAALAWAEKIGPRRK